MSRVSAPLLQVARLHRIVVLAKSIALSKPVGENLIKYGIFYPIWGYEFHDEIISSEKLGIPC
jgi:hypothetical protein